MSTVKKAVVVGKIELKPRREVVLGAKKDEVPRPDFVASKPQDRRPKRADDGRAAAAGNQAMLQELQYIKKQLKASQDQAAALQQQLLALKGQ